MLSTFSFLQMKPRVILLTMQSIMAKIYVEICRVFNFKLALQSRCIFIIIYEGLDEGRGVTFLVNI